MPTPVHVGAGLALLSAMLWGGGDFAGGFATRRASPLQVIALAQGMDAVLLWMACAGGHIAMPGQAAMLWGFWGGVANGLGLICLYTALAIAPMGLAAAIAGLLTAALPVAVSSFMEGFPGLRQMAGFLVAGVAVWRISTAAEQGKHGEAEAAQRKSLWLAVAAGIGFGLFLVASRQASQQAILWPLLASRGAGTLVSCVLLGWTAARPQAMSAAMRNTLQWRPVTRDLLLLGVTAGLLDVAGNLTYMASTRLGRMDVAAVLASLYPAATIVLAIVLLRERATRAQALGMGLAMLAVLLIAA